VHLIFGRESLFYGTDDATFKGEGGQPSTCIYKPRPGTQTGTILPHMMSSAVSSGGGRRGKRRGWRG
jgi:hypothetical protein